MAHNSDLAPVQPLLQFPRVSGYKQAPINSLCTVSRMLPDKLRYVLFCPYMLFIATTACVYLFYYVLINDTETVENDKLHFTFNTNHKLVFSTEISCQYRHRKNPADKCDYR